MSASGPRLNEIEVMGAMVHLYQDHGDRLHLSHPWVGLLLAEGLLWAA